MFSFRICMSILYIHVYTHILSPGMIWDDPTSSARLPKWSNVTARQITHHYHFFWEDFWRFLSCMDLYGIFGGNQYQLPVPTSWHFFFGEDVGRFLQSAVWLWMCFKHSTHLDLFVNKFMGCLIDFVNCKTEPLAWSCFRNVSNILMNCAADVSLP